MNSIDHLDRSKTQRNESRGSDLMIDHRAPYSPSHLVSYYENFEHPTNPDLVFNIGQVC